MPAKSDKQYRFMQMIAHGGSSSKGRAMGPTKAVAKEMIDKTPAKKRSQFMRKGKK
mgnify:CR=1 FL=1